MRTRKQWGKRDRRNFSHTFQLFSNIKTLTVYSMSIFQDNFVGTKRHVLENQELSTKSATPLLKSMTSRFRKNELLEGCIALAQGKGNDTFFEHFFFTNQEQLHSRT